MSDDGESAGSKPKVDDDLESTADQTMAASSMYDESSTETTSKDQVLSSKLNAFRNLSTANKINPNNAFDLDLTSCLHEWVKRQKKGGDLDKESVMEDVSDYLETTGKIYGCRIDSAQNSLRNLHEQLKMNPLKEKNYEPAVDDDTSASKPPAEIVKPKAYIRTRAMLTTNDKLRGDPIDSYLKSEAQFDPMELTKVGNPSKYILSMLRNTTFGEQIKEDAEKDKKTVTKSGDTFKINDITSLLEGAVICPEFSGFVSKRDKFRIRMPSYEDSELDRDGVDNVYDIEKDDFDEPSVNSSVSKETSINADTDNRDELGSDRGTDSERLEQRVKQFQELVQCTIGAKSDYSYFNPSLLAKWNGPKAWKAQTLKRAIAVRKRGKHPKLGASSPVDFEDDDTDDDDDDNELRQLKVKPIKSQQKVSDTEVIVKWSSWEELKPKLDDMSYGNNQLLPQTLKKWNSLNNAIDPPPFKMKHKFSFLDYYEIEPDWLAATMAKKNNTNEEENSPENDNQHNDDSNHFEDARTDVDNISEKDDGESNRFDNAQSDVNDFNGESSDGDSDDSLHKETPIGVSDLKNEILKVIDQESVEIRTNDEPSTGGMSFDELLQKLDISNGGISIGLAYVALLHLNNEQKLKIVTDDGGDMAKAHIIRLKEP